LAMKKFSCLTPIMARRHSPGRRFCESRTPIRKSELLDPAMKGGVR
jgi:hypothetical protein